MTTLRNAQTVDEQIEFDVEDAPEASKDQLKRVVSLGNAQVALRREIADLETQLAAKYASLKTNMEADLPEAMSVAGIEKFTLQDGIDVSIKKVVRASIPKADPDPGLKWMDDNAPDLVTRTLKLMFEKSDEKFFRKFMRDMKQRKKVPKMTYERTVHPQTLGKFVRERDAVGNGVPEKALGVYRVTTAIVSLPEDRKRKASDEIPE
jgi:hypothetical protein